MAKTALDFTHDLTAAQVTDIIRPAALQPEESVRRLTNFLRGAIAGVRQGVALNLRVGAVSGTATLTFTDDPSNNETFSLCGVTFTAKTSGAAGAQWNITSGGSAASDAAGNAASVVTMVNAHATVGQIVLASSSLGVVTFTAIVPGIAGNGFTLSESLTNATRVDFAGGSDGTLTSFTVS